MRTESKLPHVYQDFLRERGIPHTLRRDNAKSEQSEAIKKLHRELIIKDEFTEPHQPQQNPAEGGVRELKRRWYRIMNNKNIPRRIWDYGLVWVSETGNLTVSGSRYAHGRTGLEIMTGETPDISEYIDFGFYDWVTCRANAGLGELSHGKWLGVSVNS